MKIGFSPFFDENFELRYDYLYDTRTREVLAGPNQKNLGFTFENVLSLGANPLQYATRETAQAVLARVKSWFPTLKITAITTQHERIGFFVPQWHIAFLKKDGTTELFLAGMIAARIGSDGEESAKRMVRTDLEVAGLL